jgi:hypothetical protein
MARLSAGTERIRLAKPAVRGTLLFQRGFGDERDGKMLGSL